MKLLGYILAGCIMLAVAKLAVIGLALAIVLVIAIAIATKPVETLTTLGGLTVLGILNAYPAGTLGVIALVCVAGLALKHAPSGRS